MPDTGRDPLVAYADDPITNTVHHPYTAYNQGWDAADAGWHELANPYPVRSRVGIWWRMGWRDASYTSRTEISEEDCDA